jgi:hypothetical protein
MLVRMVYAEIDCRSRHDDSLPEKDTYGDQESDHF